MDAIKYETNVIKEDIFDLVIFNATPTLKFNGKLEKRKQTKGIVLHCAATPEGKDFTIEQIHKMHLQREFIGVGYNYYIDLSGNIIEGRGEQNSGAHTSGYNSTMIGICYCGGCGKDGKTPKNTLNVEQKESLFKLVYYLMGKYELNLEQVHGHYQYANKACPSFKIEWFRTEYIKWLAKF